MWASARQQNREYASGVMCGFIRLSQVGPRLALKPRRLTPFTITMSIRSVNGYACRNCADEELAKRGIDPAHPERAIAGNEVFVSPAQAEKNRFGRVLSLETGSLGSKLNVSA